MAACCTPTVSFLKWEDYDPHTGDVFLWSSRGFESTVVKFFTNSWATHVGQVVVMDQKIVGAANASYMWHAPSASVRKLPDLLFSPPKAKGGPQLNDLANIVAAYRHLDVYVRRIRFTDGAYHPWSSGVVKRDGDLHQFMQEEHVRRYETDVVEFAKAALPGNANVENTTEYFCSELTAATMKKCGVMRTELSSNDFTPNDFTSGNDETLGLPAYVEFLPEVKIAWE